MSPGPWWRSPRLETPVLGRADVPAPRRSTCASVSRRVSSLPIPAPLLAPARVSEACFPVGCGGPSSWGSSGTSSGRAVEDMVLLDEEGRPRPGACKTPGQAGPPLRQGGDPKLGSRPSSQRGGEDGNLP